MPRGKQTIASALREFGQSAIALAEALERDDGILATPVGRTKLKPGNVPAKAGYVLNELDRRQGPVTYEQLLQIAADAGYDQPARALNGFTGTIEQTTDGLHRSPRAVASVPRS